MKNPIFALLLVQVLLGFTEGFVAPTSRHQVIVHDFLSPLTSSLATSPLTTLYQETASSASVAETKVKSRKDKGRKKRKRRYNPLWPNGIDKEDIDALVESILADKSINIPSLPDVIERQIYRSTTVLTLNAAYRGIGWVHGKSLLGHEFAVSKLKRDTSRAARMRQQALLTMKTDVDEDLLEEVADRLLANKAINQPLVPDPVERAIYISCLKIVFRILNMLAASFRITLCGHDITLTLEKAVTRLQVLNAAQEAASSATAIDTELLRTLARETAIETEEDATSASASAEDEDEDSTGSLWNRGKSMIKSSQDEFIIQLHAVLYSLILGIVDDLLANTELVLMGDRIHFDIITKEDQLKKKQQEEEEEEDLAATSAEPATTTAAEETPKKKSRRSRVVTFLAGVALGACGASLRFIA